MASVAHPTPDADLAEHLPRLEPLEVHSGVVLGDRRAPRDDGADEAPGASPREVLEKLLLPALSRPPCLVSFSGGRDSSAVLAAAVDAARRHGLDDPVPLTMRFENHPRTWEADHQERVIRHLGLGDWQTTPLTDELDGVGPMAGAALARHGLYWPANAHTMIPALDRARGGSLITGNGGDELFTDWIWRRAALIVRGRIRPTRRDLNWIGLYLLPTAVRARLWRARHPINLSWLTPDAQSELQRLWSTALMEHGRTWRHEIVELAWSRYLELCPAVFGAFARDRDVRLAQPFWDPRFIRAAAAAAPPQGFPSRTAAMNAHFGDLLPPENRERSTKASFTEVFFGPATRRFAAEWTGAGLDTSIVDVEALRSEWLKPCPDFRSLTALQAAWLAAQA